MNTQNTQDTNKSILFLYTTREGQTEKIMKAIGAPLESRYSIKYRHLQKEDTLDLTPYSLILIGSSIRYGYYPKLLTQFIQKNSTLLNNKLTGFVGVNLVARKENKNTPETNGYTRKFLSSLDWKPTLNAVFAGALYYPKYGWLDKQMIRFIMWLGKGETDVQKPAVEYTDWAAVDRYRNEIENALNRT